MYRREHHLRIANILQSLEPSILKERSCFFAGGTAIALLKDEYRESVDIDFLCSEQEGYRDIRNEIGAHGLKSISRAGTEIQLLREPRCDQYGIRTMIRIGASEIKFEIVFEARISLDLPRPQDKICGVYTITQKDMGASKLLANSDRWADRSTYSRDLIDLAMLNLTNEDFRKSFQKASVAYGTSVERDLKKAINKMKESPNWLDECMDSLKIDTIPRAFLWKRIKTLEQKLALNLNKAN